jgi:hypothetical protein
MTHISHKVSHSSVLVKLYYCIFMFTFLQVRRRNLRRHYTRIVGIEEEIPLETCKYLVLV